jgi:hypothetical protein
VCPFGGACHTCPTQVQAKLAVGQPGDPFEQEADQVAERVMRMPDSPTCESTQFAGSTEDIHIQRACPKCGDDEEETEALQTKSLPGPIPVAPEVDFQIQALRGGGQLLDPATRAFMEPRLGHDFSQVRMHTDARAVGSAQVMNDVTESEETPPVAEGGEAGPAAPAACVQPTSVQLVRTFTLSFPGYLTGGGICAVMRVLPTVNSLCSTGITEEVTDAGSGSTCPASLIVGGVCSGNSVFTAGRNQVRICRDVEMPATGFVDRHTTQVAGTSVLHDSTRNPGNLDSCTSICNQRYHIQTGTTQTTLGRFQLRFQFNKGVRDSQNVTNVTVTKTALP